MDEVVQNIDVFKKYEVMILENFIGKKILIHYLKYIGPFESRSEYELLFLNMSNRLHNLETDVIECVPDLYLQYNFGSSLYWSLDNIIKRYIIDLDNINTTDLWCKFFDRELLSKWVNNDSSIPDIIHFPINYINILTHFTPM